MAKTTPRKKKTTTILPRLDLPILRTPEDSSSEEDRHENSENEDEDEDEDKDYSSSLTSLEEGEVDVDLTLMSPPPTVAQTRKRKRNSSESGMNKFLFAIPSAHFLCFRYASKTKVSLKTNNQRSPFHQEHQDSVHL